MSSKIFLDITLKKYEIYYQLAKKSKNFLLFKNLK